MTNDLFLRACRQEVTERPPVWIMRQAGRYMPEYRALREGLSFLEFCKNPELCTQATLLPIDMLEVDVAILFADILPPLEGMGASLDYVAGQGPVFDNPIRDAAAIDRLRVTDPLEATPYVLEAIKQVQRELEGRVPLIGFAGAPFTLASYLIEGQGSRDFRKVKAMMHGKPALFERLLEKIAHTIAAYLAAQVDAGVDAVQLFDSWGGCLGPAEYSRYAATYARIALEPVLGRVPTILYVNGCGTFLEAMAAVGPDVLGLDWRVDIAEARDQLGDRFALQGNLDPCVLYAPPEQIARQVRELIVRHGNRPGHIVNLGSGIFPDVPVEHARAMVDAVRAHRWDSVGA